MRRGARRDLGIEGNGSGGIESIVARNLAGGGEASEHLPPVLGRGGVGQLPCGGGEIIERALPPLPGDAAVSLLGQPEAGAAARH